MHFAQKLHTFKIFGAIGMDIEVTKTTVAVFFKQFHKEEGTLKIHSPKAEGNLEVFQSVEEVKAKAQALTHSVSRTAKK